MRFGEFLAAWVRDWVALMSGVASVVLTFWWTFLPPHQNQLRQALLIVSAVCFAFGSYRVWAKEHQRVLDLTGKTQIEALDDLISEAQALENLYASDARTNSKKISRMIVKAREQLRYHAPEYVHLFNKAISEPDVQRPAFIPTTGRKIEELNEWLSDKERFESWKIASVCLDQLRQIKESCLRKLR